MKVMFVLPTVMYAALLVMPSMYIVYIMQSVALLFITRCINNLFKRASENAILDISLARFVYNKSSVNR